MAVGASRSLKGVWLVSLRPAGGHGALRAAAAKAGARLIALSPWRLRHLDDADIRAALDVALEAETVVFTSPAAVRAARALRPLKSRPGQQWLAVGAATAAALRRADVETVLSPSRMDSEALLALPALHGIEGQYVGLVTAPGGRGRIEAVLRDRGARLRRADVYRREPCTPSAAALRRLEVLQRPPLLLLSSAAALEQLFEVLTPQQARCLLAAQVIASSPRLARIAEARGMRLLAIAASARPADLIAAAMLTAPATPKP